MSVSKREYNSQDTRRPVWGYDFAFDHKRYRQAGYRTQAEAERAEEKAREQLGGGKRLRPVKRLRFAELFDLYLAEYRKTKTEKNCRREGYRSKSLIGRFGNQFVDQISVDQIKRYADQRAKDGQKPRGTNLEIVLFRNVYRFAIASGYAVDNPAKQVPYLKCTRTERSIPTPEQFTKFMAQAAATQTGQQMVVWLWLQALSGTRPSESLFLEWSDLDFEREKILVREKPEHGNPLKKDASREIEMHPHVKELLLAWREHWVKLFDGDTPPHQWVFVHPSDPRCRAKGFRKAFDTARTNAGLPNLRPYDLRHLFCSFALMNGVDKDVLRLWMGHKSFQMIDQVYSHFLGDYRRQQMAKMQIALPSPSDGNVPSAPPEPTSQS